MADAKGGALLPALMRALVALGAGAALQAAERAAVSAAAYLVVGLLFAVSLGFLTLAGYCAIALSLGAIYAALIVGVAYLMVGLVALLVLQQRRR